MKENIDEAEPLLIHDSSEHAIDNKPSKIQILPKSLLEYFCFCCYGTFDISSDEYNSYSNLRRTVSTPYSKESPLHENLLTDLYNLANEIINENKIDNNENLWKKMGFQSGDPRTDFRAGGVFALEFMNFFLNDYKYEAKKMLNEEKFLFSLTCINLTFLIRLYLLLVNDEKELNLALKTNKVRKCSRKELKHFCENYLKDNNILFIICAECLCFVFEKYNLVNKKSENMKNFMLLNDLFLNSIEGLRKTLKEYKRTDNFIQKLKTNFEKNIENTKNIS